MDKANLILQLLEKTNAEMNRRFNENDKKLDEFKSDVNRRFDETNKRIDDTNNKIDKFKSDTNRKFNETHNKINDLKTDFKEIKKNINTDSKKLEKVYESRNKVEYKIKRDFILKNLGWNLTIIPIGIILGRLFIP